LPADRQRHRGRALPGRVGRAALALLTAALLAAAPASAEEVFTSQAAASNATDSTWIPAPPRRAAVCIVDTGTDTTPDTTNVIARLATDDSDGADISPIKHGTLMATIASAPKNDFGMVGAAPSVNVVSVRASSDGATFGALDIQTAMTLCIAKRFTYNIKVVSLSLGGDGHVIAGSISQRNEFQNAVDSARQHGLNVTAAAGNSERAVVDWPAGYAPAFAVGAATGAGGRCDFASWGATVDLWAPGCPLDVGRPDAIGAPAWANGSSEATAFVAAALAQIRGLAPELSVDASEQALLGGARSAEAGPFLDVGAAFRAAGLTAALSSGRSAHPVVTVAAPPGSDIGAEPTNGDSPPHQESVTGVLGPLPTRSATAEPLVMPADRRRQTSLPRPVTGAASVRHGMLLLRLVRRPAGAEARVEVYSRRRGKPFPSIAKRARFRTDTLRIRVSGAISSVSIGYRDPSAVHERSEVIVVHPGT
jgi:hypothetical protein